MFVENVMIDSCNSKYLAHDANQILQYDEPDVRALLWGSVDTCPAPAPSSHKSEHSLLATSIAAAQHLHEGVIFGLKILSRPQKHDA